MNYRKYSTEIGSNFVNAVPELYSLLRMFRIFVHKTDQEANYTTHQPTCIYLAHVGHCNQLVWLVYSFFNSNTNNTFNNPTNILTSHSVDDPNRVKSYNLRGIQYGFPTLSAEERRKIQKWRMGFIQQSVKMPCIRRWLPFETLTRLYKQYNKIVNSDELTILLCDLLEEYSVYNNILDAEKCPDYATYMSNLNNFDPSQIGVSSKITLPQYTDKNLFGISHLTLNICADHLSNKTTTSTVRDSTLPLLHINSR